MGISEIRFQNRDQFQQTVVISPRKYDKGYVVPGDSSVQSPQVEAVGQFSDCERLLGAQSRPCQGQSQAAAPDRHEFRRRFQRAHDIAERSCRIRSRAFADVGWCAIQDHGEPPRQLVGSGLDERFHFVGAPRLCLQLPRSQAQAADSIGGTQVPDTLGTGPGGPVELFFARAMGIDSSELTATATSPPGPTRSPS